MTAKARAMTAKARVIPVQARVSAVIAALVIVCGLEFLVVHPAADPLPVPLQPLPLVTVAWVLFVAAAWLLRGVPLRWAVALIIIGAVAIQVVAVSGPPQSSTDLYRYMWDGRVQAHGYDPYSYVPIGAATGAHSAIRSCSTTTRWRGFASGRVSTSRVTPA